MEFARALYPRTRRLIGDRVEWRITGRWMGLDKYYRAYLKNLQDKT